LSSGITANIKSISLILKQFFMPRLIGKPSKSLVYLGIAVLVAAAVVLEYAGEIDVIPGFGRDGQTTGWNDYRNPSSRDPLAPRY
jgi:hypothetical protein